MSCFTPSSLSNLFVFCPSTIDLLLWTVLPVVILDLSGSPLPETKVMCYMSLSGMATHLRQA